MHFSDQLISKFPPGFSYFSANSTMFSIKEIVRLLENELILLNQFEWRAVIVLFLQTFNPKLENNVRPYFNFICTQTVRTLDTMQKKKRANELFAILFRDHC